MIDFVTLDGPRESQLPPEQDLVKAGFNPPFKAWFHIELVNIGEATANPENDEIGFASVNIEESVDLAVRTLNEQGPFDGVFGFS